MTEKYGVWIEKSMFGNKYMGIERTTFLIDKKAVVTIKDGIGETNILETISLLDKINRMKKAKASKVQSKFSNENRTVHYSFFNRVGFNSIGIAKNFNKKLIQIDEKMQSSYSSLCRISNVIWLIPEIYYILLSSPSDRLIGKKYNFNLSWLFGYQPLFFIAEGPVERDSDRYSTAVLKLTHNRKDRKVTIASVKTPILLAQYILLTNCCDESYMYYYWKNANWSCNKALRCVTDYKGKRSGPLLGKNRYVHRNANCYILSLKFIYTAVVSVIVGVPLVAAYFLSPACANLVNTTATSAYAGMVAGGKGLYALAVTSPVFISLLTAAILVTISSLICINYSRAGQIDGVKKTVLEACEKDSRGNPNLQSEKIKMANNNDPSQVLFIFLHLIHDPFLLTDVAVKCGNSVISMF
ncbi:hypothetical protein DICVIV_13788 [Dictyocaulus viviparus]|uniref:Uncharacterized protein n=1 Tax=Dictyocaulus viviparus TaxID=29172 RepID=A0A0D8X953_DICVI|nr:hypothetical protein DICVIV_13788 [Dictyocaulus viviparus]